MNEEFNEEKLQEITRKVRDLLIEENLGLKNSATICVGLLFSIYYQADFSVSDAKELFEKYLKDYAKIKEELDSMR